MVELLSDLCCLVHVRFETSGSSKLEDVCVEGGHLGANVIKQIGLLHVIALNTDGDLLVQLVLRQVHLEKFLLRDDHLQLAVSGGESIEGYLG